MSTIVGWLSKLLGVSFRWLFGLSHNFILTLCVVLVVLSFATFPVYLKKAKQGSKRLTYNKKWNKVKCETQEKYHGNTKIVNRMYYEFSRANKPKSPISYIVVVVIELLFACGLFAIICNPISGIGGFATSNIPTLLVECGCSSEIEAVRLFAEGNETVSIALKNALSPAGMERLTAYVSQMQVFGITLFVKPDFSTISASLIIPTLNFVLIFVTFARTVFNKKAHNSFVSVVVMFFASTISILITFRLPVSITLYFVLKRLVSFVRSAIIRQRLKKNPPVVNFKDIDLYQFDDLKDELAIEDAKREV